MDERGSVSAPRSGAVRGRGSTVHHTGTRSNVQPAPTAGGGHVRLLNSSTVGGPPDPQTRRNHGWPTFTVRVELHGAEWEDYDALRVEMETEGFASLVRGTGGTAYELPAGEYAFSGEETREQVLARARRAADRTAFSVAILVTESAGRAWWGLDRA